jgi:phosphatidate cytidylyltransferase
VSDRPTHPGEGEDSEGFRLVGDADLWGSDDSSSDADPSGEEEVRRPIRARDLLGEPEDPTQFGAVPIVRPEQDDPWGSDSGESLDSPDDADTAGSGAAELPHWADPPTGEVPKIFASDDDDSSWASVTSSQPRWRDQTSGWEETDLSDLAEDLPRIGGPDESAVEDFFTFDDTAAPDQEVFSVPRDPSEPYGGRGTDPFAATRAEGPAAGRNLGVATLVGVALAGLALFLLSLGAKFTMALVVVVLVLASAELLTTLRRVGYSPPALVALASAATFPLAAYWKGEQGLVLGVALTMFVLMLWYLLGVGHDQAVANIGGTLLTVVYVAVLGSFAALLLRSPHGTGLLLAAVLGPIAYDTVGLFAGRSFGRSPLSAASPNKTVEGTVAGMVAALLVTVVAVGGLVGSGITPFNRVGHAFVLGLVLAALAPLADLCESMLKRDLGVKDMGTLLPGHGGVLDRFDSVLIALPATYYVALVLL